MTCDPSVTYIDPTVARETHITYHVCRDLDEADKIYGYMGFVSIARIDYIADVDLSSLPPEPAPTDIAAIEKAWLRQTETNLMEPAPTDIAAIEKAWLRQTETNLMEPVDQNLHGRASTPAMFQMLAGSATRWDVDCLILNFETEPTASIMSFIHRLGMSGFVMIMCTHDKLLPSVLLAGARGASVCLWRPDDIKNLPVFSSDEV